MRAMQITQLTGPATATQLVELPEPEPRSMLSGDAEAVLIDVRAAGVSFPEVLETRGLYQFKPELPFVPGSEVAGTVRSAPAGAAVAPGDRVVGFSFIGGYAEIVAAPAHTVAPLNEALDFAQGASLILNYHTAYFCLRQRGRVQAGEWVLVHGAAGGVGTATLQVARGLGARTIAVVSSEEKAEMARRAGAEHVVRSDGPWKDEARELSGGGVDIVIDPVGGDRFTDSIRALGSYGRVVVVGFTAGTIPEVKVNRLLLGNKEAIGAAWGEALLSRPELFGEIASGLEPLIADGTVRPLIGARFPLERAADALALIDERGAVGKVVLEIADR